MVVFLCPGQGSQHLGMGRDLYENYPEARERFDQADKLLRFSLSRLCFEGPEDSLNNDLNAQLSVFTVSSILCDLLIKHRIMPHIATGYSSGFYAAAYASGCFDVTQGLQIVREAGEILLDEGRKIDGCMAVIFGISLEKVHEICHQVGNVDVAIHNTPRQAVISGLRPSVQRAMDLSMKQGALDAYLLPVATAYHSGYMAPCTTRFFEAIKGQELRDPQIDLISYHSLDRVRDSKELKEKISSQLSSPVLWTSLIRRLNNHGGARLFIEVGPGTVLSRTLRWIDRDIETMNTATQENLLHTIERHKAS